MYEDSSPSPSSPNKVHTWMIILLVWIAAFSLLTVGLLLTKNASSANLSSADIALACQNGTINGITTNLTRLADACHTASSAPNVVSENKNVIIQGTAWYPGFTVPSAWHVAAKEFTGASYTVNLSDKPMIVSFFGTDAPSPEKITITTESLPTGVTFDTQASYVAAQFPATGFENVSTTSQVLTTGMLYTTEADQLYEIGGNIHQTTLNYFSPTKLVTVIYNNTAAATDWAIILASFDWSTIK